MKTPLWSADRHGDAWLGSLDNPALVLANPPSRKGRPKKGVIPPHLRPYLFRKGHRGPLRNAPATAKAAPVVRYINPDGGQVVTWMKKAKASATKKAQTYRAQFPALQTVAGATVGFAGARWLANAVGQYMPSISSSPITFWASRIVTALAPGWLVKKYASGSFGASMLVGGMLSLVFDAVRAFAPSMAQYVGLGSQPMLGYYTGGVVARSLGMGAGAGRLGQYTPPNAYPSTNNPKPMIATTAARVDPRTRF